MDNKWKEMDIVAGLKELTDNCLKEFEEKVKSFVAKNGSQERGFAYLKEIREALKLDSGANISKIINEIESLKIKTVDSQYINYAMILDVLGLKNVSFKTVIEEIGRLKTLDNNLDDVREHSESVTDGKS